MTSDSSRPSFFLPTYPGLTSKTQVFPQGFSIWESASQASITRGMERGSPKWVFKDQFQAVWQAMFLLSSSDYDPARYQVSFRLPLPEVKRASVVQVRIWLTTGPAVQIENRGWCSRSRILAPLMQDRQVIRGRPLGKWGITQDQRGDEAQ